MELNRRRENLSRLRTESFAAAASEKYGVFIKDGNVTSYVFMLGELLGKVEGYTGNYNVGFKFDSNDVKQWIDDLNALIMEYKKKHNIKHFPSYIKLRDMLGETGESRLELSAKQLDDLHRKFIDPKPVKRLTVRQRIDLDAKIDIANLTTKKNK